MRAARPALLAALLALPLAGCDKFEYLPDDPVAPIVPRVLLHRGSGNLSSPVPNTLEAMLHGCGLLDGVEMDLQLSADRTLWLGHDNEVHDCAGQVVGCFQDLSDAQIEAAATCAGVRHYDTLEVVVQGVEAVYPQKLFSFDIKGQYCRSIGREDARRMAEEVDRIVRASGLDGRVMTESDQTPFLERIQELGTPVHSLVVSLGDVDGPLAQAAALNAAGISFKYAPTSEPLTASMVRGIHQKGLRIAVWIVNGQADAELVWSTSPDVIQTDDGNFYGYLGAFPLPF